MEGGDTNAAINWRHARTKALICLACAAALALPVVFGNPSLEKMEIGLGDSLTDNRGGGTVDERLVLVGIEKNSLNVLDVMDEEDVINNPVLDAMSFGKPFPRTVYAALTEKLLSAGARMVVFDIVFAGERTEDAEFRAVLDAHPGKFVLAANFVSVDSMGDNDGVQQERHYLAFLLLARSGWPDGPESGVCQFFPGLRPASAVHDADAPAG